MSLLEVLEALLIIATVGALFAFIIRIRRSHRTEFGILPFAIVGFLLLALIFMGRLVSNLVDVILFLIVLVLIFLGQWLRRLTVAK